MAARTSCQEGLVICVRGTALIFVVEWQIPQQRFPANMSCSLYADSMYLFYQRHHVGAIEVCTRLQLTQRICSANKISLYITHVLCSLNLKPAALSTTYTVANMLDPAIGVAGTSFPIARLYQLVDNYGNYIREYNVINDLQVGSYISH